MAASAPWSLLLLIVVVMVAASSALTLQNGYIFLNHPRKTVAASSGNLLLSPGLKQSSYCPACDSSVFSYCSEKLLHDACCCRQPYDLYPYPELCHHADCSFLHANTCQEHSLITRCCCSSRRYPPPFY